jgi:hypothetical protein
MSPLHTEPTSERWQSFSLLEQPANVGSEVERAINWSQRGQVDYCTKAVYRGMELLDSHSFVAPRRFEPPVLSARHD